MSIVVETEPGADVMSVITPGDGILAAAEHPTRQAEHPTRQAEHPTRHAEHPTRHARKASR